MVRGLFIIYFLLLGIFFPVDLNQRISSSAQKKMRSQTASKNSSSTLKSFRSKSFYLSHDNCVSGPPQPRSLPNNPILRGIPSHGKNMPEDPKHFHHMKKGKSIKMKRFQNRNNNSHTRLNPKPQMKKKSSNHLPPKTGIT